jgi:hypothetical protein
MDTWVKFIGVNVIIWTLAIVLGALAQPVDISFTVDLPTVRDDGDPLDPAEIASVNFFVDCEAPIPTTLLSVPNDGTPLDTSADLEEGAHSFCFTVTDTDGIDGVMSDPLAIDLDFVGQPGAGTIREVLITCEAQRCKVRVLP